MNTCEAYDRRNNTWTYLPPLKEGRYSHSVIEYEDGKLYAIGGISKQQKLISSIEVLDKEHTVWTKLTIEIPIAIAYPAVIPIEGDMLIIAGGWIKDTQEDAWIVENLNNQELISIRKSGFPLALKDMFLVNKSVSSIKKNQTFNLIGQSEVHILKGGKVFSVV